MSIRTGAFLLLCLLWTLSGETYAQTVSRTYTFTVDYQLEASCTITQVVNEELFYPEVPFSGTNVYSCVTWQCAGVYLKLTDVSSLTVSSSSATFSPNPNGKLVHTPTLVSNDRTKRGATLNFTLGPEYEDITRDNFPVWTEGQIIVYSGLPITTYTGTATITASCLD